MEALRKLSLAVLIVIVVTGDLSTARAETNPVKTDIGGYLYWRRAGVNYSDFLLTFEEYDPSADGWCGHYGKPDTPQQYKYNHYHITSTFPYYSHRWHTPVNWTEVDAYWDGQFGPTYTKISASDQQYNCHGLTTGYANSWITVNGMNTILEAEYEPHYGLQAVLEYLQISEHADHSKMILELFDAGGWDIRVKRIREKHRDSGVYEKGNMQRSLINGYKKK